MVIFVLKTANFRWILSTKSTLTQKSKIRKILKIYFLFFIRFSTVCIFHVNMATFKGEGGVCISLVGTEPVISER